MENRIDRYERDREHHGGPSVRASCNYFDPRTVRRSICQPIEFIYGLDNNRSRYRTNLDREEFIYFDDLIQPFRHGFVVCCRGRRIRYHGREIFSLEEHSPRNKTLGFPRRWNSCEAVSTTSPYQPAKIGSSQRNVFVASCTGNAWLRARVTARPGVHTLSCKYFLSNGSVTFFKEEKRLEFGSSDLINVKLNFVIDKEKLEERSFHDCKHNNSNN